MLPSDYSREHHPDFTRKRYNKDYFFTHDLSVRDGAIFAKEKRGIVNRVLSKQNTKAVTDVFKQKADEIVKNTENAVGRYLSDSKATKEKMNIPEAIKHEQKITRDRNEIIELIHESDAFMENLKTVKIARGIKEDLAVDQLEESISKMRKALGTVEIVCEDGGKFDVDREKLVKCLPFLNDKFGLGTVKPSKNVAKEQHLHLKSRTHLELDSAVILELLEMAFTLEENFSSHMKSFGETFNLNDDIKSEFIYGHLNRVIKSIEEEIVYYNRIANIENEKFSLDAIDPLTMSKDRAELKVQEFTSKLKIARRLMEALLEKHPEAAQHK